MSTRERSWPVPVALVALVAIPLVFGSAMAACVVLAADLAKGAAWVINLAVAEWALRRPAQRRLALSSAGVTA
jgi:hypothetical protein